jgi:hypothetical protein
MRHVFCPGPPATAAHRVGEAAPSAGLVGGSGPAQRRATRRAGAASGAIDLTSIAPAADQHPRAAARAEKQARRLVIARIGVQVWTPLRLRAILFPHSPLRGVGRGAGSNCQVVVGAAPVF